MKKIIAILIIFLAIFLRTYDMQTNPPGLYVDEAAIGYNAYSILQTGKDEYGQVYPIFFRSFADYKLPLYPYISTLPINILGLTLFATRFVSLISGILLVILAIRHLGLLTGLVLAITPVFVLFSRSAYEANLALTILISGIFLGIKASKNIKLLPFSFALISLSAYAYHAERFLSFAFLFYFLWHFKSLLKKPLLLISVAVFLIVQIPLIASSFNPAATTRLSGLAQQGTLFEKTTQTAKQYLHYFSPNNLFSKPDPDLQRSFPDISVFYWWMIIPFVFGIWKIWKKRQSLSLTEKTLLFLTLVSPIPAAVTQDYFATLRALPMFLGIAWIISVGLRTVVANKKFLYVPLIFISLFELYANLVLLKHEKANVWGYEYRELAMWTSQQTETVLIDNSRQKPIYILLAFYNKIDPLYLQSLTEENVRQNYYGATNFSNDKKLNNVEIRAIDWETDIYKSQLIVADTLAVSEKQVSEHKFSVIREIKGINGEVVLRVYKTNPEEKIKDEKIANF